MVGVRGCRWLSRLERLPRLFLLFAVFLPPTAAAQGIGSTFEIGAQMGLARVGERVTQGTFSEWTWGGGVTATWNTPWEDGRTALELSWLRFVRVDEDENGFDESPQIDVVTLAVRRILIDPDRWPVAPTFLIGLGQVLGDAKGECPPLAFECSSAFDGSETALHFAGGVLGPGTGAYSLRADARAHWIIDLQETFSSFSLGISRRF